MTDPLRVSLSEQIAKILSPAIDVRAPYAKQMIAALAALVVQPEPQIAELTRERDRLGIDMEMAQAQARGWRDFFSGQPKDMPFTEPGQFAKNSQLNFAWMIGYESAQDSELWKVMVSRADRSAERSQQTANKLAEAEQRLTVLQHERDELKARVLELEELYEANHG